MAADRVLKGWIGLRTRTRGFALPFFASPLIPAALLGALGGDEKIVLGSALGFGLSVLAAGVARRGRKGDGDRAAGIMAVGTGLAAWLAAGMGLVFPFGVGAGAFFGTRMSFRALPETPPPPPPAPPAPPDPIEQARVRLARIEGAAARLNEPRVMGVARAMEGVLDDLVERPERLPQARRFLSVHLDGLERITERLEGGAAPPERLPALLEDLSRTAGELRERLRREETEALDIQVKVMSDRLREEGYR
ncbi:MAG: hypothetical protein ICV73_16175 [Acetobacteraceae bacterium]|nr:hypothetical protein [Acetobacteraceae bacterium]